MRQINVFLHFIYQSLIFVLSAEMKDLYTPQKQRSMKVKLCTLIGLAMLLTLAACRKERCDDPSNPDCRNYDPCYGFEDPGAAFKVYYKWGAIQSCRVSGTSEDTVTERFRLEVTDTTRNGVILLFEGPEGMDTYKWKVGTDSRTWETPTFELEFGDNAIGEVPVTLITAKNDFDRCSGISVLRDTFTKSLFFVTMGVQELPLFGVWEGVNTDATLDTFSIRIFLYMLSTRIENLPLGCNQTNSWVSAHMGYHNININYDSGAECLFICGHGGIDPPTGILSIDYWVDDEHTGARVGRQFVGRKLE
jgi:hypothetical protein